MRIYCGLSLITCSPDLISKPIIDLSLPANSISSYSSNSMPLWPSLLRRILRQQIRICTWDNIACHLHLDLVSPRFPNWFRFRCWFWCWFRLIWKWHKIATFEFTFAYMNTPFPWLFGYWTFRAFYTFKWDFSDAYQFVIVMGSYVCICLNDLLVMLILTNFFS